MTEKQIADMVLEKYQFVFRNNRGSLKTPSGGYIRFGIPEPAKGEKFKGSDYIGWSDNGIFIGIEIKTVTDKLKKEQINWHNFLLKNNCISEIWIEQVDGSIKIIKDKIK